MGHTGQSEDIPEAWARRVVSLILARRLVNHRGLHCGDFVLAKAFAYNIKTSGQGSVTEGAIALLRE
jgi:hypothetical protein